MPGEVVYDSILENKQKTKIFWEQLMLAANIGSDTLPTSLSKADHHTHSSVIDEKSQNNELYVAEPCKTLHTPLESEERIDSPKVNDISSAVERKNSAHDSTDTGSSETDVNSVKEFLLKEEHEQTLQQKLKSQAETKIVLEMREMKEREDEWRRNQIAFQTSLSPVGMVSSPKEDEAFISIPTTDEGNYSEYGSEEKEEASLNGINRISSEVSMNIGFHQRTQSLDSMSSGHSSGSGSVAQVEHASSVSRSSRRGITVKPLDEPEDNDISTFIWREKETPIEQEIRLAREREDELRREKSASLPFKDLTSPVLLKEPIISAEKQSTVETPKRLATKRIENEIELAKKREKELKKGYTEEETQPTVESPKTLQKDFLPDTTKPAVKNIKTSNETSTLTKNKTGAFNSKVLNISISSPPSLEMKESHTKLYSSNNNLEAMPKRFQPNPLQKGLMKRFIASRGRMSTGFAFSTNNNVEPSRSMINSSPLPQSAPIDTAVFLNTKVSYDKTENSTLIGSRPGYTSAEDKIHFELMEMRKREEELRRERARILARSQPDLLNVIYDKELKEKEDEDKTHQNSENPNKLPPMAKLRSALSNPSLLENDNKQLPVQKKQKRKSALIEEWEDRIQKCHNNE